MGHSEITGAGDAVTPKDSEKQTSAPGYSLLSLQKRVLVGLGDLPAEQPDKYCGRGTGGSVILGLLRIYGQGANRDAKEGNTSTCNISWVMGCTPEWPAGTPEP